MKFGFATKEGQDIVQWSPFKCFCLKFSRIISYFLLYKCIKVKGTNLLRNLFCKFLVPSPANTPIVCPTLFGVDVLVDPIKGKGPENSLYYFGEYESGTLHVFRKFLREDDIVLDVGAHIGFITLVIASFVGKNGLVYAIEPHPETYQILKDNIRLNQFENVHPMNIALGSEVSEARIYENFDINRGAASLVCPPNVDKKSGRQIKVTKIDTLIQKGQIQLPKLIKIDVEGFELEVLKGARILLSSLQAPALCVEFSSLHSTYAGSVCDIYNFIKNINGYFFFKLKLGKGVPSKLIRINDEKELPYHDNVFCFLKKHLK